MRKLDIDFTIQGNSGLHVIGQGWSDPEPNRRWMIEETSELVIGRFDTSSDYLLSFATYALIDNRALSKQILTIAINGTTVETKEIIQGDYTRHTVKIARDLLKADQSNRVEFLHPHYRRPADLFDASTDQRPLSIALVWLSMDTLSDSNASRPILLLIGGQTCHQIYSTLQHFYELISQYELKFASDLDDPALFDSQISASQADRVEMVWYEVGPNRYRKEIKLGTRSPVEQVVRFPMLRSDCLWPLSGDDPRSKAEELYSPRYPPMDMIAAGLANMELSDEGLYARYLHEAKVLGDLGLRQFDLDRVRWRIADGCSDVWMTSFLEQKFQAEQLFYTPTTLGTGAFRVIVEKLLGASGTIMPLGSSRLLGDFGRMMTDSIARCRYPWAVSPSVANALELRWYNENSEIRYGSHKWTFKTFILNYIRWRHYIT